MFRVLSEEEASKAVRWRAPQLNNGRAKVANTRQVVSSLTQPAHQDIGELLAGAPLTTTMPQNHTSAPELQASHPVAAASTTPSAPSPKFVASAGLATANVPLPNPSADMLQTSYDEGYLLGSEKGYLRGSEEGYLRGSEEGQARGFAEGNAALHQETVVRLNGVITALNQSKIASDDTALEQEVLELSLEIARVLLRREIGVEPEALGNLVKQGLQQLPSSNDVMKSVRLHPLDAKVIRQLLIDTENLEVIDDPDLAQGDCIVESASSVVHAGLDDWLENMASQLGIYPKSDEIHDIDGGRVTTP
jgi:flagellar assembly protein FliH